MSKLYISPKYCLVVRKSDVIPKCCFTPATAPLYCIQSEILLNKFAEVSDLYYIFFNHMDITRAYYHSILDPTCPRVCYIYATICGKKWWILYNPIRKSFYVAPHILPHGTIFAVDAVIRHNLTPVRNPRSPENKPIIPGASMCKNSDEFEVIISDEQIV